MAQVFSRDATTAFRLLLCGGAFAFLGLFALGEAPRTSFVSGERVVRVQPLQFSHKHHVGDDGIDCRYCHTSVEDTRFAGIPPTETCMGCHRQVWLNSAYLAPIYESYERGTPIRWVRVHDLPDFVYFDHGIHVHKGIGCSTCHGRVDRMPLVRAVVPLIMHWCVDCHRDPEPHLRPRDRIYDMAWHPGPGQAELGRRLRREYHIQSAELLTSCSTCHR